MADDVAPGVFALDLPELALQLADLVICRVRVGDVLAPLPRPTTMARVDRPRSICGVLYRDCILPPRRVLTNRVLATYSVPSVERRCSTVRK